MVKTRAESDLLVRRAFVRAVGGGAERPRPATALVKYEPPRAPNRLPIGELAAICLKYQMMRDYMSVYWGHP